jgi:acyl carrier protein phosphodiesterase
MNFLAHYYLDRDHPGSLFALGAATPDLLSIYNSGLRIKKGHANRMAGQPLNPEEAMLLQGIQRHFAADAAFHSSAFFQAETGHITDLLEERFPGNQATRKYFVAHVLLELLLDKVLIQEEPTLLDEYYAHYKGHSPFATVSSATERVAGKPLPNYADFLEKFLQNRYLGNYRQWEHIQYVLTRILRRVGVERYEYIDTPAFVELMRVYEERLKTLYKDMFAQMRKTLGSN